MSNFVCRRLFSARSSELDSPHDEQAGYGWTTGLPDESSSLFPLHSSAAFANNSAEFVIQLCAIVVVVGGRESIIGHCKSSLGSCDDIDSWPIKAVVNPQTKPTACRLFQSTPINTITQLECIRPNADIHFTSSPRRVEG